MDRRVVQLLVVLTLALVIAGCGLFQKPDPVKKGTVLGVVSLEGGGPLAGVTVTLDGNSVVTNDGGAFEFSGVPYGTYIITVTVDGEDHSVAVEVKGAQTTVTIEIPQEKQYATVTGTVIDTENRLVSGAVVKLGSHSAETGEQGEFVLSNVLFGDYEVTVVLDGIEVYRDLVTINVEDYELNIEIEAPSEIPVANLQLWLRSDKGVVLATGSDSEVALWQDQSGNGNDALVDASETAPTVVQNSFGTHAGVHFTTEAYMRIPHADGLNAHNGFTVFIVHRNGSGNRLAQKKSGSSGLDANAWFITSTQGLSVAGKYKSGTQVFPNGDDVYLQTNVFEPATKEIKTYSDGELKATLTLETDPEGGNTDDLFIGKRDDSNPLAWAGDLFELIIYNTALSDSDRVQVEQYLRDKYGL